MKARTRAPSTGASQWLSRLKWLPTMKPSASATKSPRLSAVMPLPMRIGRRRGRAHGGQVRGGGRGARERPGDHGGVRAVQGERGRHVAGAEVGRERVAGVLLLDVREDLDAIAADLVLVALHAPGLGVDQALVADVGVGPGLGAHELQAGGERDGHRRAVGGEEHLDADGQGPRGAARHFVGEAAGGRRQSRQVGGDLRAHLALGHGGKVVHVLEQESVHARGQVGGEIRAQPLERRHDARKAGHAGAGRQVQHGDHRLVDAQDLHAASLPAGGVAVAGAACGAL